ncbi:MAG: AAA family ATPase [bacterium]
MNTHSPFHLYRADGTPNGSGATLPPLDPGLWNDDPSGYVAEPGLQDAVNVSLALGQPLLVTGEPGTGKTQLAASIGHALGLPQPLVFRTKSTSTARDLFYRYDSLRHFHDAQFSDQPPSIEGYIHYDALGLAILLSMPSDEADPLLPHQLKGRGPIRSVVLIDEVDKAPRDLPNDVLDELESMSFTVKETGRTFAADRRFRPAVVLTSNSEKTLPDAFLRRCVFYHLTFPDHARLGEIVRRRLGPTRLTSQNIDQAIRHFESVRQLGLRKKPSTAELIAWLRVVDAVQLDFSSGNPSSREALALTYSILAKSKEDVAMLLDRVD